ncbi:MAG: hypothetical protein MAG453_00178 [Calditrichaeota bacterium]|nr:hypothetical protein [Calditrichota bacterium]
MGTRAVKRARVAVAAVLAAGLSLAGALVQPARAEVWEVEPAPEWTELFDTNSGWTGADGIYSIPIDGDESPGGANTRRTLFVFSDTFIGEVNGDGERLPGTTMVHNTLAWMPPGGPDPGPVQFWYRGDDEDPGSVFVPDTPDSEPGDDYWPGDGIVHDGAVYYLAGMMYSEDDWFYQRGVAMIRLPLSSRPPLLPYQQWDVPLYVPESGDRGAISFTGGIMANTESAGAPEPDGYIYIYGNESVWLNKFLLVARAPEQQFPYVNQWTFWDGEGWSENIGDAARMTDRISPENSVTPLPDGRFILVFQLDTITRYVAFRIGDTPHGPWGPFRIIYAAPEPDVWPDLPVYTYNAKAHPHLSEPGELLISYNVNVNDFWAHFDHADIYRPRFIRLIYTGNAW